MGGSAPLFDPQIGGESENQKIFPAFRRVGQTSVPVSRAITPPLTTAPTYPSPPATLPGSATASPPWWKQTGSNIRGRRGSFKVQKLCRRGADRGGRSRRHGHSALRASTRSPPRAFSLPQRLHQRHPTSQQPIAPTGALFSMLLHSSRCLSTVPGCSSRFRSNSTVAAPNRKYFS